MVHFNLGGPGGLLGGVAGASGGLLGNVTGAAGEEGQEGEGGQFDFKKLLGAFGGLGGGFPNPFLQAYLNKDDDEDEEKDLYAQGISPLTGIPFVNPETEGLYDDLLSDAKGPGGYLSPARTSTMAASRVPTLLQEYFAGNRNLTSALRQGGTNRSTALGFAGRDPFRGLRGISDLYTEEESRRVGDRFAADTENANLKANLFDTGTQRALDEGYFKYATDKGIGYAKSAGNSGTGAAVGTAIGGFVGLGPGAAVGNAVGGLVDAIF